jgi:hypothetical protein
VFWGTNQDRNELLQISPNGVVSVLGQFTRQALIGGLAFNPATDTLYGVDDWDTFQPDPPAGGATHLVTINLATRELTNVGLPGLGLGLFDLDSLAFNPADRMLYAVDDGDQLEPLENRGRLVRMDPTTGAAEFVGLGYSNAQSPQGLAFVVPEPTTCRDGILLALLTGFFLSASLRPGTCTQTA